MTRRPCVAGQFYPGHPGELRDFLDRAVGPAAEGAPAVGGMSPHAGYVYSGGVAGALFRRVRVPDTVLLLGPNHTGLGAPAAVSTCEAWATPLGEVPVDRDLTEALLAESPVFEADDLAHAHEHSLEVQIPFLQYRNPGVSIAAVAFMLRSWQDIQTAGEAVARVLAERTDPVLMVASTDMSHYEPDEVARQKDRLAIERVLALDPRGLLDTVRRHGISMCGAVPTAVMLVAARALGASAAEMVEYATSGDASGDYARVVGYAAVMVR